MPILMSSIPFTNVSSAFARSAFSDEAGMTSSQRSFQTLRPTSRVDLKSGPVRIVEWRRIVATESLVPSRPEKDEIQKSAGRLSRQVVITYEVHAKNPELRDLASDCRSLSLADM